MCAMKHEALVNGNSNLKILKPLECKQIIKVIKQSALIKIILSASIKI